MDLSSVVANVLDPKNLALWISDCANFLLVLITSGAVFVAWRSLRSQNKGMEIHDRERILDQKSEMYDRWTILGKNFHSFWNPLHTSFARFLESHTNAKPVLDDLILASGPPINLPSHLNRNLVDWSTLNEPSLNSDQRLLWQFAQYVYPGKRGPDGNVLYYSNLPPEVKEEFHQQRHEMSHFWEDWLETFDSRSLGKPYSDQRLQVIMLAWLEVALQICTQNPGPGKVALFDFANVLYEKYRAES